jgi:tetratricopeptide (TPR) repeat protein
MNKITAFVARRFSQKDELKIAPILRHLNSFRDLGFVLKSAEPAEAERVSQKVWRMIAECDVFVGVLTKRHPVFGTAPAWWQAITGRLRPLCWTPPAWVIQESGYALALEKDIILFVEPGVELPFLPGDLEYIPYSHADPARAFTKASEMINKLIATGAGIAVETVVQQAPPERDKPKAAAPSPEGPTAPEEVAPAEPSLREAMMGLIDALLNNDRQKADELYNVGLKIIETGRGKFTALQWRSFYLRVRSSAGDPSALDELKTIVREYPNEADPQLQLGLALLSFKEYEMAAGYFEQAAARSAVPGESSSHLLQAAAALIEAKASDRAEAILVKLLDDPVESHKEDAAQKLYGLLMASNRHFPAFGIAEQILRRNPGLGQFRFRLGLDYHEEKQHELFLYHYHLLEDHEPTRSDVMRNLALALSECDLPVTSVSHYKRALELGETLSASNLGYKYLDAGMTDEAKAMLTDALRKPDAATEVGRCLAEISEREKEEGKRCEALLQDANTHREFLIALGEGLYDTGFIVTKGS